MLSAPRRGAEKEVGRTQMTVALRRGDNMTCQIKRTGRNTIESRVLRLNVFLVFALLLPARASAYTFSPEIATLTPAGDKSSVFFQLNNKTMKVAAVEITIDECHKDLAGKTVKVRDADEDFMIYPSQIVMMPGDEAGVQVRWIGNPELAGERAYTITAREVPIPQKDENESANAGGVLVKVTVLINYEGRIYVTPKGSEPDIVVESVTERTQDNQTGFGRSAGKLSVLEVICENKGTAHKEMSKMSFLITPVDKEGAPTKEKAIALTIKDVPLLKTNLLAGDRRQFVIPWPDNLPYGRIKVALTE